MHRQFAGLGDEQIPVSADEVAVIEQAEQLPTVDFAAIAIVAYAHDILAAHVNLQAGNAVGQMNEGRLAHYSRRRGEASGHAHMNLFQFGISRFERLRSRLFPFIYFWFVLLELLDNGSNRVFTRSCATLVAALEFVRINVSDQPLQSLEMFAARSCLIVFFEERD